MLLDWQTYVLQRRINRSPAHVTRAIVNPSVFGPGSFLTDDPTGALVLDEPFRRIDTYAEPVWRATGRVLNGRHRALGGVEVEISAWSAVDTQLLIRPRARRPDRWSGRRTRSYFAAAHRSADSLVHLLSRSPEVAELEADAQQWWDEARF